MKKNKNGESKQVLSIRRSLEVDVTSSLEALENFPKPGVDFQEMLI